MFPPGTEPRLKSSGEVTSDVRQWFDSCKQPNVPNPDLVDKSLVASALVFEQEPHEALFVPSGWYHQVENLDLATVSINHNWFNGTNLSRIIGFVLSELA